ncbi:MAG: endonuclease/exonuclease/phosphatase family protein [Rhodobacteraceae bacterium]|nr:endonuclease/exonuclease/phosphatase family protein [Paracoccaceae bacterium]
MVLPMVALGQPAELRVATWQVELSRDGPGLLLRDLQQDQDPQIEAVIAGLLSLDADVIVLTDIDFDMGNHALNALADQLAQAGLVYPTRFALPPNSGLPTGFDLDGNGRLSEARDAMGYGRFAGDGGMAILSRYPLADGLQDMTGLLWRDLPGALLPPDMTPEVAAQQRLSTTAHWAVPLQVQDRRLTLLAYHASPPVFDGPEDRNGRRNHDETAFWLHYLAGQTAFEPPLTAFVIAGDANLDPVDGEGRPAALRALLAHPAVQDPAPRGSHGRREAGQSGDPALDTALFDAPLGGLRLDYLLPSADLQVTAAGVLWPPADDPLAATLATASRHRPVWVDLTLP